MAVKRNPAFSVAYNGYSIASPKLSTLEKTLVSR